MNRGTGVVAAATMLESREWYLASHAPENVPTADHLKLRTTKVCLEHDLIPDQHVVLQTLLISVDPYLRSMMTGRVGDLYLPPLQLDKVITGFGMGRVIKSKNSNLKEGDIVINPYCPVAEYCVVPSDFLQKIHLTPNIPLPNYMSSLGVPGFTAWVAIELIGNPKPESNVFISAAAGGVGMFAGQLAKFKGCRVVGSTGSDEKVQLLKDEFGYDDAFNYRKESDLDVALAKYFPNGIDFYLDNVGGKMLEAVLNNVNKGAHIAISGMMSQYNTLPSEREGVKNLMNMVGKEVKMEGFLCGTYLNRFGEFAQQMEVYLKEEKIIAKHKINEGIESFFESFVSLFSSSNLGKVIVQVAK